MRRPLHAQLSTLLRGRILRGTYGPGGRIESEHALAARFGISRNTVRVAIASLVDDGFLVTRPGSGTYTCDELPHRLRPLPNGTTTYGGFVDDLLLADDLLREVGYRVRPGLATTAVAEVLGCRPRAPVIEVRRSVVRNGTVCGLALDVVPADVGARFSRADLEEAPTFLHVLARSGCEPGYAVQIVEPTLATATQARQLGLTPPAALLDVSGRLVDERGRVISATTVLLTRGVGISLELISIGAAGALADTSAPQ